MQRSSGFSLIELLAGMAFLALMLTLAVSQLPAFLYAYRLDAAVRNVAGNLQRARLSAVAKNANYQMTFPSSNSYQVMRWDRATGSYVADGAAEELPSGITMSSGGDSVPTFSPTGSTTFSGGGTSLTISVSNSTKSRQITITSTGKIAIQ